jgi:hypothetical protein
MLGGRVAGDEVDQHSDAQPVRVGHQVVKLREGAKRRIDRAVIGDVVAEVDAG